MASLRGQTSPGAHWPVLQSTLDCFQNDLCHKSIRGLALSFCPHTSFSFWPFFVSTVFLGPSIPYSVLIAYKFQEEWLQLQGRERGRLRWALSDHTSVLPHQPLSPKTRTFKGICFQVPLGIKQYIVIFCFLTIRWSKSKDLDENLEPCK